jgi:hypothetical protein
LGKKLHELILRDDSSIRAIAKELKCYSKTVVKYGKAMGLERFINSSLEFPKSAHSPGTNYESKESNKTIIR